LSLEYIQLAPHFVKEVLEIYDAWNGKDGVPAKIQELMMVLEIELSERTNDSHFLLDNDTMEPEHEALHFSD